MSQNILWDIMKLSRYIFNIISMQQFSNVLLIYYIIRDQIKHLSICIQYKSCFQKWYKLASTYLVIFIPQHCDLLYLQYQNKARSKLTLCSVKQTAHI